MKAGRGSRGSLSFHRSGTAKLPHLPPILVSTFFVFLAGFYASYILFPRDDCFYSDPGQSKVLNATASNEEADIEIVSPSVTSIPFQILSWKPRALYFPNFATAEQCESIIGMARGSLRPSGLTVDRKFRPRKNNGIRTSSGTFLETSEDKTGYLDFLEKKIANITMIPTSHGERFNILRYEIGQKYLPHYDSFDPEEFGPLKSQRIASFLIYLSDVEEGGETVLPFESDLNTESTYNYKDCVGFKVKPRRGDGLLFYSLYLNGTIDPASLHGACPVIKGEKWVATKWLRNQDLEIFGPDISV